jgi:hypothetical protein
MTMLRNIFAVSDQGRLTRVQANTAATPPLASSELIDAIQVLIQTLSEAVVLVNGSGRIAAANHCADRMFGCEGLRDKQVDDLLPRRLRDAHSTYRRLYAEAPEHRAMGRYPYLWGQRIGGEDFCVQIELLPFSTTEGVWTVATLTEVPTTGLGRD